MGVGLGPGDPGLMSIAARDAVRGAKVISYIHANDRPSMARKIAAGFIGRDAKEIPIPVDMKASEPERRHSYDHGTAEVIKHLAAGRDVIFLCEGDPLFYGSFVHLAEKISEVSDLDQQIKSIPGISSVHASASAASVSLASDNETFFIVPATMSESALAVALARPGALAVIKIGNNLEKLKRQLKINGRLNGTQLVSNASTVDEKIENLADVKSANYFSLALVPALEILKEISNETVPANVGIVVVNKAGLATGQALKKALAGAKLYSRVNGDEVDEIFSSTGDILQKLFYAGAPIVAIASSGIVIRSLAELVENKKIEPPVVAVSNNGAFAVPLLGGHHGANRLARAIANALGGVAAITTASDGEFGMALDDPPPGWNVGNVAAARGVVAEMLAGGQVNLSLQAGSGEWLVESNAPFKVGKVKPGEIGVVTTMKEIKNPGDTLILHPPVLVLGVGCERDCDGDELYSLVMETLEKNNLSPSSVACVCSLDLKSDEAAVLELAKRLNVPPRFFTASALEAQSPRLENPSDTVFAEVGCHGVAEGAALAACGTDGKLIVEKQKSRRATVAVGLSPSDINPESLRKIGHGRGRLYIVGTGPGRHGWRTPEAIKILTMVSDVVGYELYLDIVADLIVGKTRHTSQLAEEEARVRMALELAASGRDVALVSSGDPGIYAMAALAFELLDREDKPTWNRLQIEVVPGISAFQAAAARIGAPMGHDFCLISLSDLLTPWEVIENRLEAAARGGFAVAFYNPVSKRRTHQLETARDILLKHRKPDTPVVLGRNLGRDGENVRVTTLAELSAKDADMLTMVIVGGPETQLIERGVNKYVYTPRGYGKKMETNTGVGENK